MEGLILKQLRREASPQEQGELQDWLDADAANREEYEALAALWDVSGDVLQARKFDGAAAWSSMRERMAGGAKMEMGSELAAGSDGQEELTVGSKTVHRPWRRYWMAAAAVLLVLCGAGGWLFYRGIRLSTTSYVAAGANRSILLPDGSRVWLRKGSTLQYTATASGVRRVVNLKGGAYFEVAHDPANPFVVKTPRSTIEDVGTSFIVLQESQVEKVIVTAGSVRVRAGAPSTQGIVLTAGEKVVVTENGVTRGRQTDPNFLSWKTNVLDFNGTPLDEVAADIHDLYGIPVGLSPDVQAEAGRIRVTAKFPHSEDIKEVLDELKLMTGLSIQQEKDTLIFFRK